MFQCKALLHWCTGEGIDEMEYCIFATCIPFRLFIGSTPGGNAVIFLRSGGVQYKKRHHLAITCETCWRSFQTVNQHLLNLQSEISGHPNMHAALYFCHRKGQSAHAIVAIVRTQQILLIVCSNMGVRTG